MATSTDCRSLKSLFKNIGVNKLASKELSLILMSAIFGLFGRYFQFQTLDLSRSICGFKIENLTPNSLEPHPKYF